MTKGRFMDRVKLWCAMAMFVGFILLAISVAFLLDKFRWGPGCAP